MSILSEFTVEQLETAVETNPYLRGYLQGYLAEIKLMEKISAIPGITNVSKIPDHDRRKGDVVLTYRGEEITIEAKSIRTGSVREDILNNSWSGTVGVKSTDSRVVFSPDSTEPVRTTCLDKGGFDILAISCYAVEGNWDFVFIENRFLPEADPEFPGLIKTSFVINPDTTPCLSKTLIPVLDDVVEARLLAKCFL